MHAQELGRNTREADQWKNTNEESDHKICDYIFELSSYMIFYFPIPHCL